MMGETKVMQALASVELNLPHHRPDTTLIYMTVSLLQKAQRLRTTLLDPTRTVSMQEKFYFYVKICLIDSHGVKEST